MKNTTQYFLKVIVLLPCIILTLSLPSRIWALQPPQPGEIEELEAAGALESRLEMVDEIGNYITDPFLVYKIQQKLLSLPGMLDPSLSKITTSSLPPFRQGMPTTGNVKIFVLLIEFQDDLGTVAQSTIDNIIFGDGILANYPRESLTNYYNRSSYGLLNLSGVTFAWYQTAYDRSAVVQDKPGREVLIKEVLDYIDNDIDHDFTQYDSDNDGDIDYFIVMWAGEDEGWGTFWHGQYKGWLDTSYTLDGMALDRYSWQRESTSPAVVIHETGHALGLPDLYDSDPLGPDGGVGGFDPMDANRYDHNCFSKWMFDWLSPVVISGSRQNLTLAASATTPDCVLIWPGITTGDIFSEFYLVENRQSDGNDDIGIHPDGLAIWHVDATLATDGNFLYNNVKTDHKLIRLMEADGLEEIETGDGNVDRDDLYTDGDEFGPDTSPSSDKYDGTDSCVRVWDIVDQGTTPGAEITAAFSTVCNQPPVCDAGGPYTAECQGASTSLPLDGTGSSDPDPGDTISYLWFADCPAYSFDGQTSATPTITINATAICNVTLGVTDMEGDSDFDTSSISVSDTTPPDISCPPNVTIECDASKEPSNTGMANGVDICDPNPSITYLDSVTQGSCPEEETITRAWTVTDYAANSNSCTQTIQVVDTTPPLIQNVSANPKTLWPVNHKMVKVDVSVTATDNCDSSPECTIVSVDSNEPVTGIGDGNTAPDWFITGNFSVDLRAERSGVDTGRIYTITVSCTDGCGNRSNETTEVMVQHNQ